MVVLLSRVRPSRFPRGRVRSAGTGEGVGGRVLGCEGEEGEGVIWGWGLGGGVGSGVGLGGCAAVAGGGRGAGGPARDAKAPIAVCRAGVRGLVAPGVRTGLGCWSAGSPAGSSGPGSCPEPDDRLAQGLPGRLAVPWGERGGARPGVGRSRPAGRGGRHGCPVCAHVGGCRPTARCRVPAARRCGSRTGCAWGAGVTGSRPSRGQCSCGLSHGHLRTPSPGASAPSSAVGAVPGPGRWGVRCPVGRRSAGGPAVSGPAVSGPVGVRPGWCAVGDPGHVPAFASPGGGGPVPGRRPPPPSG